MVNVGEEVAKREPLSTVGGNVNQPIVTVEISLELPGKTKNRTTI